MTQQTNGYGKCSECCGALVAAPAIGLTGDNTRYSPATISQVSDTVELVCSRCGLVQSQPMSFEDVVDPTGDRADMKQLIPYPPPCICGNKRYTISYHNDSMKAQCTRNPTCSYTRYFHYENRCWTDPHAGTFTKKPKKRSLNTNATKTK